MKLNEPNLIIDLNDNKIVFFVISFNEKKDFKILKKIIIESSGIQNGRIIDIERVTQILKKNISTFEEDLDYFFSVATVIINPNQINCLNVSGYKKLNGSQISKKAVLNTIQSFANFLSFELTITPLEPFAAEIIESFVEVSPSTEMRLKKHSVA